METYLKALEGYRTTDRVDSVSAPSLQRSVLLIGILVLAGCREPSTSSAGPVVLLGVDGASWNVIRELWSHNQLPHLRRLAERGVSAQLQPVANESPVIWTSIATGVEPSRHGIQGFTVRTPSGESPVSSVDRRVPAIWNMASTAELRVALLGWWASWPAETINGVVVSDRILKEKTGLVSPAGFDAGGLIERERSDGGSETLGGVVARQDRLLSSLGQHLAAESFDLLMIYLRNVDAQSHHYWKYFRPRGFENEVNEESLRLYGQRIPDAYAEVDATLGALIAGASPETNVFVLSDHGFQASKGERYRIQLHLDRVLDHLGYLVRDGQQVDPGRSQARSWNSPPFTRTKLIRFRPFERSGAQVQPDDPDALRDRLESDLRRITYEDGSPAFRFRDLKASERSRGGDMVVIVRYQGVSPALYLDGRRIPGAIGKVEEISGTHSKSTEGIFIAAGPDIDSTAELTKVHSLDITPTLLYALGLPVAEDFDGRARIEIFQPEFQRRFPLQTVSSWGELEARDSPDSQADEELLEELRALGYLN